MFVYFLHPQVLPSEFQIVDTDRKAVFQKGLPLLIVAPGWTLYVPVIRLKVLHILAHKS